jgi:hypothetical protein
MQQCEPHTRLAQEVRLLREEQVNSDEAMKRILKKLGGMQEAQAESDRASEQESLALGKQLVR